MPIAKKTAQKQNITYHFFEVSLRKIWILSIATFGLYFLYWGYKQWCIVGEAEQRKVLAFVRSLFSPIFMFSLLPKMKVHRAKEWAIFYLLMNILGIISGQAWWGYIPFFASFVPFAVAQQSINKDQKAKFGRNERFSSRAIIATVIGAILWGFVIIASINGLAAR